MTAQRPAEEPMASPARDPDPRRMDGSGPDLERLSISDLEALLAEKRRSQSKRLLRAVAGRTDGHDPAPPSAPTPAGLAAAPPPRRATRRLFAEEVRAALGHLPATPAPRWAQAAPPADRFRRSGLTAVAVARRPRGPAWLRRTGVRKGIDVGLQLAEVCFVLLFIYVIAQWLFADAQTDTNIAAEMAAVAVPTAAPAAIAPATTTAPTAPAAAASLARPTATAPPAVSSTAGASIASAASGSDARPAVLLPHDGILRIGPLMVPSPGAAATPSPTATVPATVAPTSTATPSPTATPNEADAVISDPSWATEIRIPKIKLDARVREVVVDLASWTWEVADFMAGHHTGTANPGDQGNVVIAGHRDIRGSVFLHLDLLKPGDEIFLYSGRGVFRYVVRTTKIVLPSASEVMEPTTDSRLTLITCTPVKIASHRLIVIADLDRNYVAPTRTR